jgi:hypothetical protein
MLVVEQYTTRAGRAYAPTWKEVLATQFGKIGETEWDNRPTVWAASLAPISLFAFGFCIMGHFMTVLVGVALYMVATGIPAIVLPVNRLLKGRFRLRIEADGDVTLRTGNLDEISEAGGVEDASLRTEESGRGAQGAVVIEMHGRSYRTEPMHDRDLRKSSVFKMKLDSIKSSVD